CCYDYLIYIFYMIFFRYHTGASIFNISFYIRIRIIIYSINETSLITFHQIQQIPICYIIFFILTFFIIFIIIIYNNFLINSIYFIFIFFFISLLFIYLSFYF